jgi:hypothetical protein
VGDAQKLQRGGEEERREQRWFNPEARPQVRDGVEGTWRAGNEAASMFIRCGTG